jgi:hypothetical protein
MVWVANAVVVLVTRRLHRVLQWRNAFLIVIAMTFSLLIHGIPRIHKDRVAELRDNSRAQVSPAEVHAMLAAARLSPANARFFVFNQRYGDWYTDMVAEWFPYIARRQSVDTVQGQEWLPNNAFQNAIEQQGEVELSGSPRVTAMILKQLNPDYIFIAEPFDKDPGKDAENQQALANSLRDYAGSPPIYENSEVAIYKIQRSHGQDRTNP